MTSTLGTTFTLLIFFCINSLGNVQTSIQQCHGSISIASKASTWEIKLNCRFTEKYFFMFANLVRNKRLEKAAPLMTALGTLKA